MVDQADSRIQDYLWTGRGVQGGRGALREEEFLIPVEDDSDSANSEGEETGDDVEDGDAGVDGEEAKQSEEEQKYDEVVEDGVLEPGQIEAAIQEEGAGGLRDWEQKAPGPRPVPFVLDDFLNKQRGLRD